MTPIEKLLGYDRHPGGGIVTGIPLSMLLLIIVLSPFLAARRALELIWPS